MSDQISADLAAAAAKAAPPVSVAVAATVGAIRPESILIWLSIVYTLAMLSTLVIKNWDTWLDWWRRRWSQAKAFWRWIRKPE